MGRFQVDEPPLFSNLPPKRRLSGYYYFTSVDVIQDVCILPNGVVVDVKNLHLYFSTIPVLDNVMQRFGGIHPRRRRWR